MKIALTKNCLHSFMALVVSMALLTFGIGARAKENVLNSPPAKDLQKLVQDAYSKFKEENGGKNADYIPYLASVPSHLFGVVIATVDGQIYAAGDVDYQFAIERTLSRCEVCSKSPRRHVDRGILQ